MLKFIASFIITLFAQLYERVAILLTRGKHLHDRITSLTAKCYAHKTSLTQPLFIAVYVPIQKQLSGHAKGILFA